MADKYLVFCRDQPGSEHPRAQALADHLKHLDSAMERVSLAAGLKNEDGRPSGSIMIVEADSPADAERFVMSDPFFTAGVWESLEVHHLGRAVGNWVASSEE
ncbi:MAG TPA: YciI family protein [Woeseiaceae bacterium]|nr:YciI family protein [Woeseiaceae bacterium]